MANKIASRGRQFVGATVDPMDENITTLTFRLWYVTESGRRRSEYIDIDIPSSKAVPETWTDADTKRFEDTLNQENRSQLDRAQTSLENEDPWEVPGQAATKEAGPSSIEIEMGPPSIEAPSPPPGVDEDPAASTAPDPTAPPNDTKEPQQPADGRHNCGPEVCWCGDNHSNEGVCSECGEPWSAKWHWHGRDASPRCVIPT